MCVDGGIMNVNVEKMTYNDIISIEPDFSDNFDKFWSVNILKDDFNSDYSQYIVAKIGHEIVGFAGIKVVLDEADIMNIVTRIDKRNLGIGSILLEELLSLASELKCKSINLEVNESNLSAIHLYEKYNFKRIGLRKKYYNNTDNAILMKMDF